MSTDELLRISIEAGRMAHTVREDALSPSTDQEARAWERLADAANALHAMRMRARVYPASGKEPT